MLSGEYRILYDRLTGIIDKRRILHDSLNMLALGTDASFYRLIPKMVIRADNEKEVSHILRECSKLLIPATFRAAGTSLSGQAITDSVLVIAGSNWKKYRVEANGNKITLQPGLTGAKVNSLLAPLGRKIGPDPASINSAMIGGIAANNASGMCCGTAQNSYKTVEGMRIIMADGTVLDTRDKTSREQFRSSHNSLLEGLSELAKSVIMNEMLASKIRHKYKIKNTTGYSLNALTDFTDPFDIIEHLLIGSEGTLGFISEISYKTVILHRFRASSLMIFPGIRNSCEAVKLLKNEAVSAVELIDRAALRSVENKSGMPSFLKSLDEESCALLVETVAENSDELKANIEKICNSIASIPVLREITFTDVPSEYESLWNIRKGLFPAIGAMRKSGTTVIIEDVAFPVEVLAEATIDLQNILQKYKYNEAVIFGHALEGNLHFVFPQDFSKPEEVERYGFLMTEVSALVVNKFGGSLKAEHGTGRNMAPFVELEWGKDGYELMKKIKLLFDPNNILNPGIILNSDLNIHLRNLKPLPPADELIDKCTECGFCEVSCVSAGLTLTPRQRIAVYREICSLTKTGEKQHLLASLNNLFRYAGDETCATDGLCSVSCPVGIDTGKFIKKLRAENSLRSAKKARWIAERMSLITASGRIGLKVISFFHTLLGNFLMKFISKVLRRLSFNKIPLWNKFMPSGSVKIKPESFSIKKNNRKFVYFPSCINRTMGLSKGMNEDLQLSETIIKLSSKAGYDVIFPDNMDNLCCGMAFMSKGFTDAGHKKSEELEAALLKASNFGEYPVLCDMSPCLFTMKENMKSTLKLCEPVEFISTYLLPNLKITPVKDPVAVFAVCSMKKMGLETKLEELAKICSTEVTISESNCCGFAGDRGFTHPELNAHGLRNLKEQMKEGIRYGYSTSRTCETGLSLHSGIPYKSIVYLVDKVSEPINSREPV